MTRPASTTARHLFDAIEKSSKTQKEIAREAGFASPNILSMMKTGETKVPSQWLMAPELIRRRRQ